MEDAQQLWQDYRSAWEAYSRKHADLQCLMDSVKPEKSRIEGVTFELEKARAAHSAARDRLANHLSSGVSQEKRVRSTAQLLWEMAGRPEGTAEGDWLRAEELIRSSVHASN